VATIYFLCTWFAGQLAVWLFIRFLVGQQTNILIYMREHVGRPNTIEGPLHKNNFRMACTVAALASVLQLLFAPWYFALVFGLLMLPFWSLFYDRGLNKALGNDKDYLGDGASTDMRLKKGLGGKRKNLYSIIAIILINAAAFTLLILYP
jgi:hypothetical protein